VTAQRIAIGAVGALLLAFLALPVIALFVTVSFADLSVGLQHPLVLPALRLSVLTTVTTLCFVVLLGTPLAWLLASRRGRLGDAIETAVQLPIVIPPAVAGVAMLLAFGRRGLLAGLLYPNGWSVVFSTAAVVMAEVFVSAPFYIQAATSAFRRIDAQWLVVAKTFGASPWQVFYRIALPLSARALVAGAAMSWARALGEFGATLMFAGNLEGRTQTLPLAIYTALESDMRAAQALSIILVVVAFALLMLIKLSLRRADAQDNTQ
jgi:molybdate transport system permease protein